MQATTPCAARDGFTTFIGGPGNDTADFSQFASNLTITLDNKPNDGSRSGEMNVESDIENVIGGSGNDLIIGNPSFNHLYGGPGNDTIYGGSGNDTLEGGHGHDQLFGQDGDDLLIARMGRGIRWMVGTVSIELRATSSISCPTSSLLLCKGDIMKFDFSTEILEPRRLLSAGDLDPSFGAHGLVLNPLSGDAIAGVVPLADGKLMIANTVGTAGKGDFQVVSDRQRTARQIVRQERQADHRFWRRRSIQPNHSNNRRQSIARRDHRPQFGCHRRIDQKGSLDHSYSGDGKATFDQKQPTTIENASADSSGRKLALGTTSLRQFREVFAITGSGSTDSGFGEKGHLTVDAILEEAHPTGPRYTTPCSTLLSHPTEN